MDLSLSKELYMQATKVLPGGVNSPVRAFKAVGGNPIFMQKASGSTLWDVDGNKYVDFVGSWGPAIVGHAHPEVCEALTQTLFRGLSFGAPTQAESELAAKIIEALPSVEKVRLVSSGTEACMSAVRLARAASGRKKILRFIGHYHGHADLFLTQAGSGLATLGLEGQSGVPKGVVEDSLLVAFNQIKQVEDIFSQYKDELACVILEPIMGNSGFIRPKPGFLEALQELCRKNKTLLIFDEVMTGFRVAWGGWQNSCDLKPDLTVLGKVIGGGLPLAAFGGKADLMQQLAPDGPVYQAGTLSGNPLATASGNKTLEILSREGSYRDLNKISQSLCEGFLSLAKKHQIRLSCDYEGGMFGLFFQSQLPSQAGQLSKDAEIQFKKYFKGMLEHGIYWPPSAFEACFVSLAHTKKDVEKTLEAADKVFAGLN